ncbi:MAG: nucleotidyltransferase family protein [Nitrospirae bacterium]|nr:nucleotidyltransferase family protein [Nitrospirota bacterium]
METKQEILSVLSGLKSELRARFNVTSVGVFGSFVRGEQRDGSDIDVLVDFSEEADLFDLVGLGIFLEEKLGRRVDVVPRRALRAEIRESVLRQVSSA